MYNCLLYCRDDPARPVEEILETLEAARKAGYIRYYGCSNWTLPRILEAENLSKECGYSRFVCNQIMWSLEDINQGGIAGSDMVAMDPQSFAHHKQTGLSAMAYMSIAKGYFSKRAHGGEVGSYANKLYENASNRKMEEIMLQMRACGYSPMDAALLYFKKQPFPAIPIASFNNEQQLKEALSAMEKAYPQEWMQTLLETKKFLV